MEASQTIPRESIHVSQRESKIHPVFFDILLGSIVLASRIPFLFVGYGTDNDAWALARAARHIALTGQYEASRLPGFPLQEYITAFVWQSGPVAVNFLTALFSAICVSFFSACARKYGLRDYFLVALSFAFIPTVYISSASGMDYMWAMAFLMISFYAVLSGNSFYGGAALGLATGARLTSIIFLLPYLILLFAHSEKSRFQRGFEFIAVALVTSFACFIPVMLRYPNFEFLSYYETFGAGKRTFLDFLGGFVNPNLPFSPLFLLGQATVGVWGIIGSIVLSVTLVIALVRWILRQKIEDSRKEVANPVPKIDIFVWLLVIFLVWVLYLRLPHDEGYLIPALPFLLLLIALIFSRWLVRILTLGILISPFLVGVDIEPPKKGITPLTRSAAIRKIQLSGETFMIDFLRGPVLMDYDKRIAIDKTVEQAILKHGSLPDKSIVLSGLLERMMLYYFHPDIVPKTKDVIYIDKLSMQELKEALDKGYRVYYLPDARERTIRAENYDPADFGAEPLLTTIPSKNI
ncbi:MAG TPA: hypothetical protein VNK96_07305 [Fimbriimonadales bacterium]|nr:hypothetical protein [Fimbriimonadales bacterium]